VRIRASGALPLNAGVLRTRTGGMTTGPSELPDSEAVYRPKPPLWQSATPAKAPSRILLVFSFLPSSFPSGLGVAAPGPLTDPACGCYPHPLLGDTDLLCDRFRALRDLLAWTIPLKIQLHFNPLSVLNGPSRLSFAHSFEEVACLSNLARSIRYER
jgi:hypothetical protein